MAINKFSCEFGGKTLSIETGKLAQAANGACLVTYGNTVVLATAVMSAEARAGLDFFPLMVDYEEKLYAAGRIKGSRFIKREGRPTDEAVLVGRFIDRALRPLFDQRLKNDVQVIVSVLAFDGENDPDISGLIGAVAALQISDIPFNGPIAACRVNLLNGEYVINGSYSQRLEAKFDVDVAGTTDTVIMLEAGCDQASEEQVLEAIGLGQQAMKPVLELLEKMRKEIGKPKREPYLMLTEAENLVEKRKVEIKGILLPIAEKLIEDKFFAEPMASKTERAQAKQAFKTALKAAAGEQGVVETELGMVGALAGEYLDNAVTKMIVQNDRRVDGRAITEIRALGAEVKLLPRVHGSGYFTRGETQVLSVCTLGAPGDKQTLDGMELVGERRFMHHYNFPPFSVGEAKPLRGAGRREIGHGALAEKALQYMIPAAEEFPYTIRVVSETLMSNGSSSMGSTCGASLALMDAGVPIKAAVAGIAIGLASDGVNFKVITDLQDLEDGMGGMDFKITGTEKGITAIQLDTKTVGLPRAVVEEAYKQGLVARLKVLEVMKTARAHPRAELSEFAPRILTLQINPERIREVIGPGGKMINEIIAKTGVASIDIEQTGLVLITSVDAAAGSAALEWVKNLTREVEVGEFFTGKVIKLMDFGAFVEFLPGKEGLVHVSEMAPWRVEKVTDIVKVGDTVQVKLFEIDDKGRLNLSMKQAPGNVYPEKHG